MKRKNMLIVYLTLVLVLLTVIGFTVFNNSEASRIKKQLNLGNKYLLSFEYEQAIAEFNKVISVDPMNVEAYIGLADAYMGMEDYDKAVSVLQNGINCLEENGESAGAAILQDKLDQILSGYEQNSGEPDVDEEDNNLSENAKLPIIILKPIVDAAALYGVPANEWSVEKLIEQENLELVEDHDHPFYRDSYDKSDTDIAHEAKLLEEDNYLPRQGSFSWSVMNSEGQWDQCMWFYVPGVNNQYYFWQNTEDDHVLYEYVAKLFKDEGITDAYSLMHFIGLNESQAEYIIANSDVGQERIGIETDFGKGSIAVNLYEDADRLYEFYMEIYVNENKEHGCLKEIAYRKDKDGRAMVSVYFYRE